MYYECIMCKYIYIYIMILQYGPIQPPKPSSRVPGQHVRQPAPLRCTGIEAFRRAQGLPKEYR